MKNLKRILITFFVMIISGIMNAQNPIPSYNIPVYYVANFQEAGTKNINKDSSKGKRKICVVVKQSEGQGSCQATVWIYSIDEQDILGPYTVSCEELLSVDIDEREWGVLVQSDVHVYVDVWIDDGTPLKICQQITPPLD